MEGNNKCVGCGENCGKYVTCRECVRKKHDCVDCGLQIPLQYTHCKDCNSDIVKPPQKLAERLIDLKLRCEKGESLEIVSEIINCMIALNFKINNYANKEARSSRTKKFRNEK